MKLLHDDVAIEPDPVEDKTASGIYLREAIATYPPFGTVRHIGPSITEVKPGDRVVYEQHAGKLIKIEGKEYDIVHYEAVLAKLV